jgi:hypothetical protein
MHSTSIGEVIVVIVLAIIALWISITVGVFLINWWRDWHEE